VIDNVFLIRESKSGHRLFPLRLQPETRHELKGLRLSGHEKSAIVKADRDPTIFAALDYFADLTLQRYLGSPCESFSDQPDSIANLESALDHGTSYRFAFSPSSTRRRGDGAAGADIASVQSSAAIRKQAFSRTGNAGWPSGICVEDAGKTDSHNCK
jgi:hypothetical protein